MDTGGKPRCLVRPGSLGSPCLLGLQAGALLGTGDAVGPLLTGGGVPDGGIKEKVLD